MAELTKMQVYLEGANSIDQYHPSDGFALILEGLKVWRSFRWQLNSLQINKKKKLKENKHCP